MSARALRACIKPQALSQRTTGLVGRHEHPDDTPDFQTTSKVLRTIQDYGNHWVYHIPLGVADKLEDSQRISC
jgi:hypothetical protein